MATVHRAKKRGIEGFERVVALKRLLPHQADDEAFVRSFIREARLASHLQHANIVHIHDLGKVGPIYYIAMEYVRGRDLRHILKQARFAAGPPPLPMILSILWSLCDALEYAHTLRDEDGQPLGLVHRDVSPSNLIIAHDGHLKVIDFGIAGAQAVGLRTQTGLVKGKFAYMAPEIAAGQPYDRRSDLFSVGIIAWELLCARPLFAAPTEYQTIDRVRRLQVPPPSQLNPLCPTELDQIVLTALAREPDARWQSAAAVRRAIDGLGAYRATTREMADWVDWAFSGGEAPPPPPTTEAEEIEELSIQIVWGGGEETAATVVTPQPFADGTPAAASPPATHVPQSPRTLVGMAPPAPTGKPRR